MKTTLLLSLLFFSISLTSCGATKNAEAFTNFFLDLVLSQDFDGAAQLIESKPLQGIDKAGLVSSLYNDPAKGKLLSYKKKMGFSISTNNGVTQAELPYKLTYEKGSVTYTIISINRGSGFKIEGMQ